MHTEDEHNTPLPHGIDPYYNVDQVVSAIHLWERDWLLRLQAHVGKAQAWYYPTERTAVLWECFLQPPYHLADQPAEDPNIVAFWRGFERFLTERFPRARSLVTPHADPLYPLPAYQRLLTTLGYQSVSVRAFGKEIPRR